MPNLALNSCTFILIIKILNIRSRFLYSDKIFFMEIYLLLKIGNVSLKITNRNKSVIFL